jgi:hypothetical protein
MGKSVWVEIYEDLRGGNSVIVGVNNRVDGDENKSYSKGVEDWKKRGKKKEDAARARADHKISFFVPFHNV